MKWLLGLIMTALCVGFALIPEGVMYFLYHLVSPQTEAAKVVLVLAFLFAGTGISVFFAILGLMAWISGIEALVNTRF